MARSFNGTSDFITIGAGFSIPSSGNPLTISIWYLTNSSGLNEALIGSSTGGASGGALLFKRGVDDTISFGQTDQGDINVASTPVNFGSWQNVIVTYDGSATAHIFQNGSDISGATTGRTLGSGRYDIGRRRSDGDLFWNGSIAEVGVWNVVLGASDITALQTQHPLQAQPTGLIGFWPLYGNVSPEPDKSSFGNDAVLTGTSFVADGPVSGPFQFGPLLSTTLTNTPAKAFTRKHYYNEMESIRAEAIANQQLLEGLDEKDRADRDYEAAKTEYDEYDRNLGVSNYAKHADAKEKLEKARKARDHHYFMDVVKRAWDEHNKK